MNKKIAFLLIAFFSAFMSQAKVTLPALIADNMVIQRDSEVMMWGKSSPQSSVRITTSWNSETIVAVSDKSGNWILRDKYEKYQNYGAVTLYHNADAVHSVSCICHRLRNGNRSNIAD